MKEGNGLILKIIFRDMAALRWSFMGPGWSWDIKDAIWRKIGEAMWFQRVAKGQGLQMASTEICKRKNKWPGVGAPKPHAITFDPQVISTGAEPLQDFNKLGTALH